MLKKVCLSHITTLLPLLAGCASLTTGTEQQINISTGLEKGATCQIRNEEGTWKLAQTPGTVNVQRCNGSLSIQCQKDDKMGTQVVESKLNPVAAGNIPMPGSLLWAGVDLGTGAAFQYPEQISVSLKSRKNS